mmetsp:Transcript_25957/g.86993  ORF Transcript_25957/g.86993 Transcript_25957/m.86993 type:complete len:231 (-) Transcript_25957:390-1082(-)
MRPRASTSSSAPSRPASTLPYACDGMVSASAWQRTVSVPEGVSKVARYPPAGSFSTRASLRPVKTQSGPSLSATAVGRDWRPRLKLPRAPACTRVCMSSAPSRHFCANSGALRSAWSSAKRSRPPERRPRLKPRASRAKIFLRAHFMARRAGSPAYTPETKGSITFSNTSRPRCRVTKLSTDSSPSAASSCSASTPGRPRAPRAARILPGQETRSKLRAPSTRGLFRGKG